MHTVDTPQRPRRHATVVVCLSLASVLMLGQDHQPGPGVGLLGTAWDTMAPHEQAEICDIIDTVGTRAAARQLVETSDVDASMQDAEFFIHGLACDIHVQIEAG